MEEMIQHEDVSAIVDMSLHEMADHRFGGDYDAGPVRGTVALDKGIPTILAPGNIDFLVTGVLENAQKAFSQSPLSLPQCSHYGCQDNSGRNKNTWLKPSPACATTPKDL